MRLYEFAAEPPKKLSPTEKITQLTGLDPDAIGRYERSLASIESGGVENPYAVSGGAGGKYHGTWQMGPAAMKDAAASLGISTPDVSSFKSDPDLQRKMFQAYTAKNAEYIMSDPEAAKKFQSLSPSERAGVLAMAHSAGHGGAKQYLLKGKESYDAWQTPGSRYREVVGGAVGDPKWTGGMAATKPAATRAAQPQRTAGTGAAATRTSVPRYSSIERPVAQQPNAYDTGTADQSRSRGPVRVSVAPEVPQATEPQTTPSRSLRRRRARRPTALV